MVNPADMALPAGATLMVVGSSKKALLKALKQPFTRLRETERERLLHLPQEVARAAEAAAAAAEACQQSGWLLEAVEDPMEVPSAAAANAGGAGDNSCEAALPVLECVPLLVGNPDSESLDADSVPCVPAELASRLTTPAAVKAFVQEFQQNKQAQREQLELGSLKLSTAQAMAAEATATAAAAAASAGAAAGTTSGSGLGSSAVPAPAGGSIDYGGCAVDWNSEGSRSMSGFTSSSSVGTGSSGSGAAPPLQLSGHFIICGAEESFCAFVEHLRKCGPSETPIVVLHPTRPDVLCEDGSRLGASSSCGPIHFVEGSASEAASLRQAGASTARALIYLARAGGWMGGQVGALECFVHTPELDFLICCAWACLTRRLTNHFVCLRCAAPPSAARPVRSAQGTGGAVEKERSTREAVLADAQALLAVSCCRCCACCGGDCCGSCSCQWRAARRPAALA